MDPPVRLNHIIFWMYLELLSACGSHGAFHRGANKISRWAPAVVLLFVENTFVSDDKIGFYLMKKWGKHWVSYEDISHPLC